MRVSVVAFAILLLALVGCGVSDPIQMGKHFSSGVQSTIPHQGECDATDIGTFAYDLSLDVVVVCNGFAWRDLRSMMHCNGRGVVGADNTNCECVQSATEGYYSGTYCSGCSSGYVRDSSTNLCTAADSDGDGVADAEDNCVSVVNTDQSDVDSDGVGDVCDVCPSVADVDQADADSDGVGDLCDVCPSVANADQTDTDFDLLGNACDNCPLHSNVNQEDTDSDGVGNACDNCASVSNANQEDSDGDGIGNVCDICPSAFDPTQSNSDGDSFGDACDTCPYVTNPGQEDADGDSVGDVCDNCINHPNSLQRDSDSNGAGDVCDFCPFTPGSNNVVAVRQTTANGFDGMDHCYVSFSSSVTGDNAGSVCASLGTGFHMATISDSAENSLVYEAANSRSCWIGFEDRIVEGSFGWVTGESISYTNWGSGEPNNSGGDEDCTVIRGNDLLWNDGRCSTHTAPVACEGERLNRYEYNSTTVTWSVANAECESRGGHLVSFQSANELALVFNAFGGENIWIGLHDHDSEGNYVWTSGEPATYFNWNTNEPNNSNGNEHCIHMRVTGKWNDHVCEEQLFNFICEYE